MSLLQPGCAGPHVCAACDGHGYIVVMVMDAGRVAQKASMCYVCQGTGLPAAPPKVNGG